MQLPKTISPCPIRDASFEIRFTTKIPSSAVFGVFYSFLQGGSISKIENLPVLQLPEAVRSADINLKFKPHYRFLHDNFSIQVGPQVIIVSSPLPYVGWESFNRKIVEIIGYIEKSNIVNRVIRIGMRYINFLETNIFDHITLTISGSDGQVNYPNSVLRTQKDHGGFFLSTLQIANTAQVNGEHGSIIDIDTFRQDDLDLFFKIKKQLIETSHREEKLLFFALLKPEFIRTLNPVY